MVGLMYTVAMADVDRTVPALDPGGPVRPLDPPAVVRGWLHDRLETWWALLVGAPPVRLS